MVSVLIPENDQQELWELNGRVKALKGYIDRNRKKESGLVYVDEIDAILGWGEYAEKYVSPCRCHEEKTDGDV